MKHLYLVGGTMGVGKTSVCRAMQDRLDRSVMLDGDWCWMAKPFVVTEETKCMVQKNIAFLLSSFISCTAYDNIIFCWVMHEQSIIDSLLSSLDTSDCMVHSISLTADKDTIVSRIKDDIKKGIRTEDVIERTLARLPLYDKLNTLKVDTTNLTIAEAADKVISLCLSSH